MLSSSTSVVPDEGLAPERESQVPPTQTRAEGLGHSNAGTQRLARAVIDIVLADLSRDPRSEDFLGA